MAVWAKSLPYFSIKLVATACRKSIHFAKFKVRFSLPLRCFFTTYQRYPDTFLCPIRISISIYCCTCFLYSSRSFPNLKSTTTNSFPSVITLSGRCSSISLVSLLYSNMVHSLYSCHLLENHSCTCGLVMASSIRVRSCAEVISSLYIMPCCSNSLSRAGMSAVV